MRRIITDFARRHSQSHAHTYATAVSFILKLSFHSARANHLVALDQSAAGAHSSRSTRCRLGQRLQRFSAHRFESYAERKSHFAH